MTKIFKTIIIFLLFISLIGCDSQNKLNIHIISDIHYAPRSQYDYVGDFKESSETNGSGKQMKYQEEILDAYINEEIENHPDYIFITGDLVFSGSKENHELLSKKLKPLLDNGIKVLVVPGNHDFDNIPFSIKNNVMVYGDPANNKDFKEIYANYGYKDAIFLDGDSLSYFYKLDNNTCLIALDTITQYGLTFGSLKDSTLDWIKERLEYAKANKLDVIMIGHHNLFYHNEMFEIGYTLDNSDDLRKLMKEYNVHLYISGHMHIQDIIETSTISEILNESFSIFPHRYGELVIKNHEYQYKAKEVNVEKYGDQSIDDIKNYSTFGYNYLYNNFHTQRKNGLKTNEESKELDELLDIATIINIEYFGGVKDENDYSEILDNEYAPTYIKGLLKYLKKDNLELSGTLR